MTEVADARLAPWQNYYVIVGSSGGALIGIQFVVITLIAYMRRRSPAETVGAFGTPTVMHLAGALLVSAIMSAPWPSLFATSVALGVCGIGGFAYSCIVIRLAHRQTGYEPVWEDWLWYAILPLIIYATVAVSAVLLRRAIQAALFMIGASALSMLLIGIHNAWDTVTHLVITSGEEDNT